MRMLREWAPMVLVMLLMLTLGARVLTAPTYESLAQQGSSPATADTVTPSQGGYDPATSQTTQPTDSPTTDPALGPTSDPALTPTTDPALTPTTDPAIPDQAAPTDELPTPTAQPIEPTATPTITATPTPEGASVSCQSGTVVELRGGEGDLIPDTPLLVYIRTTVAGAGGTGGAFQSFGGPDVPTISLPPIGTPGAGGGAGAGATQVIGSGFVRFDGYFRLAVALGRLKAGNYPIEVRERDSQRRVGSFVCNVSGAVPTALVLTPQRTPAPEEGSAIVCLRGDELQITGLWQPRAPVFAVFDGREVSGVSVRDDGTYNLVLTFDERIGGDYIVEVTERGSRTLLTRFTCQVPVLPTITPRNDEP